MIRDYKLFDGEKTRHAKLKDHLAYVKGEPEKVAKDFNLYTETGVYSWSSVANILKDCANRPCDDFGTLEVKNDHTGIIYHRYEAVTNVVYLRVHVNGAWTEWEIEVTRKYVDEQLSGKAPTTHTHTKSQITDFPTKVSQFTNDSKYQNEAQVKALITQLVNSAPETLDTLKELADALGNDPNFATTITNLIGTKAPLSHNHDDNYYTKEQTDTKLGERLKIVEIISPVDIRTLLEDGIYHISDYGVATQCTNMPISEAGTLEVRKADNAITQSFRPYKYNEVYYQGYNAYDNVWFPWEKISNDELKSAQVKTGSCNELMPETEGIRFDAVFGETVADCPLGNTTDVYSVVSHTHQVGYGVQFATTRGNVPRFYMRRYGASTFEPWAELLNRQIVTKPKNFNSMNRAGIYEFAMNDVVSACANKPSDFAGTLIVGAPSGAVITQTYMPYNALAILRRNCTDGKWSGWAVMPHIAYDANTKTLDVRWI